MAQVGYPRSGGEARAESAELRAAAAGGHASVDALRTDLRRRLKVLAARVGEGAETEARHRALIERLHELRGMIRQQPYINPIQQMALEVCRLLDSRDMRPEDLDRLVQWVSAGCFVDRAARLGAYLGECDPKANDQRLEGLFRRLGRPDPEGLPIPFEDFQTLVEGEMFGIVATAHPTFSLGADLLAALAQLAGGRDQDGRVLDREARDGLLERVLTVQHKPDQPIDLALEHRLSMEALEQLQNGLRQLYRIILAVARELWPDRWTELTPRLITLATWVGYDVDGRSDIRWTDSLAKRMISQRRRLDDYRATVRHLMTAHAAEADQADLRHTLELLESRLDLALQDIDMELEVMEGYADDAEARERLARVARRMWEGRERRLVRAADLATLVDRAVALVTGRENVLMELLVLRAEMANTGLAQAHPHFRLNASQLHNAIRPAIGMEEGPEEPTHRRTYLNAVDSLIRQVGDPATINFGSLLSERASAKRQFMIIRQILTYFDADTPIRFLIAETEQPFTLLTALYYARLFGVADRVDISPLFETAAALEHGPAILREALEFESFRTYVEQRGRLCIQLGFSDSGRYLGQIAAGHAADSLRREVGRMLADMGLGNIQIVIFNTHGESIGRGAHPAGFEQRLRYLASPRSRHDLAACGLKLKEEVSFQGGDGYAPLLTAASSYAVVTRVVEYILGPTATADIEDPFYGAQAELVDEFFATVRQFNDHLIDDDSYAALLGTFGANLLYQTGSRPRRRQHEGGGPADVHHPSQIRAIPHNGILQQLGILANTVCGAGQAMAKHPERFRVLYHHSNRFRLIMDMVAYASRLSEPDVMRAYINAYDPGLWLLRAARADDHGRSEEYLRVADRLEKARIHPRLIAAYRTLARDFQDLECHLAGLPGTREAAVAIDNVARDNMDLIHAIRVALIQRILLLATHVPRFSDQHGTTSEELLAEVLHLEIDTAVQQLERIFPIREVCPVASMEFGEEASYHSESVETYEPVHHAVFQPMGELYDLIRRLGTGIVNGVGAIG